MLVFQMAKRKYAYCPKCHYNGYSLAKHIRKQHKETFKVKEGPKKGPKKGKPQKPTSRVSNKSAKIAKFASKHLAISEENLRVSVILFSFIAKC